MTTPAPRFKIRRVIDLIEAIASIKTSRPNDARTLDLVCAGVAQFDDLRGLLWYASEGRWPFGVEGCETPEDVNGRAHLRFLGVHGHPDCYDLVIDEPEEEGLDRIATFTVLA